MSRLLKLSVAVLALSGEARAQNLSGVFGPVVREGNRNVEYRAAIRSADDGRTAQRLHYEAALNDRLQWRMIAISGEGPEGGQELENLTGQLFYELRGPEHFWRTGLRFDARVRNNGPGSVGFHWANEFALSERVSARANLMTGFDIGDEGRDGLTLETRLRLTYRSDSGADFGIESFNLHGSTARFEPFGNRRQIGPYASLPLGGGWAVTGGVLFGVGEQDPPADLRFRLGRSF